MKVLKPPTFSGEAIDMMMNGEVDFLAVASDPSTLTNFKKNFPNYFGVHVKETKVIDYTDDGRVAFIRYPGNSEMFHYYLAFNWPFVIATSLAILFLSVIMVKNKFKLKNLIETYIDLYSLALTKSMPRSINNCDHVSRLVLGPVMLLFLFTSIYFCNLILDEKVMKIPCKVIDSWDDLALKKNLEIVFFKYDFMSKFVELKDNDMARNFAERKHEIPTDEWMDKSVLTDLAMNISNGKAVLVKNKLTLIFLLMKMAKYVEHKDPYFLDKVHLSEKGSTSLPYFIPSFHPPGHPCYRDLNKV